MADTTTTVEVPGAEFDAYDHGHDMASILRVAVMHGVVVPGTDGPRCLTPSKNDWMCTRLDDHEGRHHATVPAGVAGIAGGGQLVIAVWHQQDW